MQQQPPSLVILAAGMASRYGSMKQIQAFGPSGETIMDYSIYDAIRAGFKRVVFIIRKDFANDFREIFEPKLKGKITIDYVYQDLHAFTNGYTVPSDRTKPWGTAHAVLCARDTVKEPFAVINADDFYGRDAFQKAADFCQNSCTPNAHAIIGYDLLKTLSENGTVNRGVCVLNETGDLRSITERINISRQNGQIVCDDNLQPRELPINSSVSMNFWCFHPSIFDISEQMFYDFVGKNSSNPKAEFFIPLVADNFIKQRKGVVKVISTTAQWFGVTYKEDAPGVQQSLQALINDGTYPTRLWT
jgi:NDP-sugar pyrophosphorylase family protein